MEPFPHPTSHHSHSTLPLTPPHTTTTTPPHYSHSPLLNTLIISTPTHSPWKPFLTTAHAPPHHSLLPLTPPLTTPHPTTSSLSPHNSPSLLLPTTLLHQKISKHSLSMYIPRDNESHLQKESGPKVLSFSWNLALRYIHRENEWHTLRDYRSRYPRVFFCNLAKIEGYGKHTSWYPIGLNFFAAVNND